jgi:hypothetical protein
VARRAAALGLLALLLTPASCSEDKPEYTDLRNRLSANRLAWDENGSADYQFDFKWICFCVIEYTRLARITVTSDSVTAASFVGDGSIVPPDELGRYRTVEGLFDLIEHAINGGAASITAAFDSALGYPTDVNIDYDADTVDEELGFVAQNLVLQ